MAQLKWRDSEDVYKPISRSLREFLQEKQHRINQPNHKGVEALYRELSNKRMSVFVEREAEDQLIHHLGIDPYNETGGVLVGQAYFCPDTKNYYTEIVGSIAAPYTVGNRVHFQFTPECWQAILSHQKQDFPRTTIVGWYHSHPGHGIFLSGTDLNTQRLCFKQIWQIAVVYDPLRLEIGFFYSADGRTIDAIYLQEVSQSTTVLQKKTQQLNWRQPEPKLPTLPLSSSGQPHNSYVLDEGESQDNHSEITEQVETKEEIQNKIIILLIVIVLFLFLLILVIGFSQFHFQKSKPTDFKPTQSQPST